MSFEPRVTGTVVTASETADLAPEDGWTLHCAGPDGTIVLPGSGRPIKFQGLTDQHFADAIELLTLSAADTDVPARDEWLDGLLNADERTEADRVEQDQEEVGEEDPGDGQETGDGEARQPEAGADEDGMPDEYADIEREKLETAHRAEADTPTGETDETPAAHTAETPDGDADYDTGGPTIADLFNPPAAPVRTPATATPEAAPVLTKQNAAAAEEAPEAESTAPATLPVPTPTRAADDADDTQATSPAVLLLGRVVIDGAIGGIDSNLQSAAVELVSYLALNPGADHHAIDDALWPGRLVNKQMRNAVISRTRSWLGKDADGEAYFPRVQDTGDSRYRLVPVGHLRLEDLPEPRPDRPGPPRRGRRARPAPGLGPRPPLRSDRPPALRMGRASHLGDGLGHRRRRLRAVHPPGSRRLRQRSLGRIPRPPCCRRE
ncbi:hypothetical protein [Streptomyces sp. NRRL S-237]|uniref:hypothetical protein n=1 Tax=Streptomyces sp. NRRL S-237 TaxID=1463895 RepID=UPI0018FF440C|nr:hypothetical protein [Streptomyces sp. NRRL S-237]